MSLPLLLKALLGAAVVVAIALLSKSRSFYIAGMVPLFPTFALIAHYVVGSERTGTDLRQTALFGLWSLFPYAVYLTVVYYLSVRATLLHTLLAATFSWSVAAAIVLILWMRAS